MTLHLGFELPQKPDRRLNERLGTLTPEESRILKAQIKNNGRVIQETIMRLDLLVNKEGYPADLVFVERIRQRLFLLMEENDTFRRVLWRADAGVTALSDKDREFSEDGEEKGEAA